MNCSELIRMRLCKSDGLASMLATFAGEPAIFSPNIPEHNQTGWSEKHYPILVYNYDLSANAERNSAGTLEISMLCQNTEDVPLERIEKAIREAMQDVIITPEGGTPFCFTWARTEGFTTDEEQELTIGNEVRFDILEYPSMVTTDPDPVMAANRYMKEIYPECLVMGYDRMGEIEEATAGRPVIYCRLQSSTNAETTNTVAWMDCLVAVHILCPDIETRTKMAADISNRLSVCGEINMFDNSPLFVKRLQVNYRSDYMKEGQVFLTGHYGVLRYRAKGRTLRNVYTELR